MIVRALTEPERYAKDIADGTAEPLPWWVDYVQGARYYGCPPWELVDEPTPRRFWLRVGLLMSSAEAEAQRTKSGEGQDEVSNATRQHLDYLARRGS